MIDYNVPFVGNTPDDMHCLQAAYAMIRQYFDPQSQIEWDEWSQLTGFVPGKGTWSMAGLMWFKEQGYDVAHIGTFDFRQFVLRGTDYLVEALGEEVGRFESEFVTDLLTEKDRALRFTEMGVWFNRVPTIQDIYDYLNEGYLIKCLVNLNALNDKPGYLGHAVVVKGYSGNELIIHDPGLPASANRHVSVEKFNLAWTNPVTHSEKLDAIRKATVASTPVVEEPQFMLASSEETVAI